MIKIFLIYGPNLNLTGIRDKKHYGDKLFEDINKMVLEYCENNEIEITIFQSNFEGKIIDKIHEARNNANGIIINPGAYAHYSYAIRDAIEAVDIPTIDIHFSNIYNRESFRHVDVCAPVCQGLITGLGINGIFLAIKGLVDIISQ